MADGIHAVVLAVEAPIGNPALDSVVVNPDLEKLLRRDPAVLASSDSGDVVS